MGPIARDITAVAGLLGLAAAGGALFAVPAQDGSRGFTGTSSILGGAIVVGGAACAGLIADDAISALTRRGWTGSVGGTTVFALGLGAAVAAYAGVRALTD